MIQKILIGFVALQHLAFLVLEMFLWTQPIGQKIFRNSPEKAQMTAALAANQGLYNGFLAAGLIWAILHADATFAREIALFFLGCVIVAGLYGGWSVSWRITLIQSLPAILAAAFILLKPNAGN